MKQYRIVALLMMVSAMLFSSCQSDFDVAQDTSSQQMITVKMTVEADQIQGTRALSAEDNQLTATWSKGDDIMIYRYKTTDGEDAKPLYHGFIGIRNVDEEGRAEIVMELWDVDETDRFVLVYPSTGVTDTYSGKPLTFNEEALQNQDGSLSTIAKNLDVVVGETDLIIDQRDGRSCGQASAYVKMKNKRAMANFEFKGPNGQGGTSPVDINSVKVMRNGETLYTVKPEGEEKPKQIYMAFDPIDTETELTFLINDTYFKRVKARLEPGKYYKNSFSDLGTGYDAVGSGTAEDPWQIYLPSQLEDFNTTVKECNFHSSYAYFKQMNDIDLSSVCHPADEANGVTEKSWDPMGGQVFFKGCYDGNYHTISGLYIGSTSFRGLFGSLGTDNLTQPSTVANLTVEGTINANSDMCTAGAIAGQVSYARITGCTNKVTISGNHDVNGFVGTTNGKLYVVGCKNEATIKIGTTDVTATNGFCTDNNKGEKIGCYNAAVTSASLSDLIKMNETIDIWNTDNGNYCTSRFSTSGDIVPATDANVAKADGGYHNEANAKGNK